nr:MAG TPA: hypothetical protein [Caudoviricetes sp.]
MAKVIDNAVITNFSFSVHDIENSKDSVLAMLRSFRVMNKVTDNMWNNIVDSIVREEYESIKNSKSVMDFFDNRISVKADPTFRRIVITDADENVIIVGYSNGYYQTTISIAKADKIDSITQEDLLNFFKISKTIH